MTQDAKPLMHVRDIELDARQRIAAAITELGGAFDAAELPISPVPEGRWGDVALPCFVLRGKLTKLDAGERNNPATVARALADAIEPSHVVAEARAVGPYVNLAYRMDTVTSTVLSDVLTLRERYGADVVEGEEHVVIEFSAPNTNKPQHLGHVRNNVLGEATARCMHHAGYRVTKVNLVNDRGIHICKSMLAYRLWGEGTTPERAGRKGDHLIGEFYVLFEERFREEYEAWKSSDDAEARYAAWLETPEGQAAVAAHESYRAALAARADEEAGADARPDKKKKKKKKLRRAPEPREAFFTAYKDTYFNEVSDLGRQAREMLRAWEAGEEAVMALWRKLNGWVLEGFERTYERLGVSFAKVYRESDTYMLGKDIIEEGLQSGVFYTRDDGAVVFDLQPLGMEGEKVMLRSDGTSVYITQDLGTAIARFEEHAYDHMIYVVANEQDYHFKVLFAALAALRPQLAGRFEHLSYGMVNLPKGMGKMKSREGTAVDADDLMDEMQRLSRVQIDEKLGGEHYDDIDEEAIAHRAERIGLAALKYFLLDVTPSSSMVFDPTKSIDLQGRTGAYCLYNYARTRSLLRKAGVETSSDAPPFPLEVVTTLESNEERRVVDELARWPEVVAWAAQRRDPSKVAEYLFELCKSFAFLFTDKKGHPIISCGDQALRAARLCMVDAVGTVLRLGLGLLGIDTLEEM